MQQTLGGALEDVLIPLLDPAFRLGTLLLGDTAEARRRVQAVVQDVAEGAELPPAEQAPAWFLRAVFATCRPGRPVGNGDSRALVRAIGHLPAEDRALLFFHYWLQLSPGEVAEAAGLPREELAERLELEGRFGPGVRALDVSEAIEALTEPAPYGFERQVLKSIGEPVAASRPRRYVPPLTWAGIAAIALAGLLLVVFIAPRLDPGAGHKLAGLAARPTEAAASPSPAAPPSPSPAAVATAPAPSPSPSTPATACPLKVPQEAAVGQPVPVSAVRVGTDSSRDRFVVQLDGPIPPFELKPAGGGWLLTISGASPGSTPSDLKPGYPVLSEVKSAGGAAGTTGWYLLVNSAGACPAVSTLSGPSRIVIDFPHA